MKILVSESLSKQGVEILEKAGFTVHIKTKLSKEELIRAMTRQIPQATASMKARKWEKDRFMGVELYNKTLGIVGIGQIGGYLAKLAQGMSMNVIAYDPYLAEERATKMGVEMVELAEL